MVWGVSVGALNWEVPFLNHDIIREEKKKKKLLQVNNEGFGFQYSFSGLALQWLHWSVIHLSPLTEHQSRNQIALLFLFKPLLCLVLIPGNKQVHCLKELAVDLSNRSIILPVARTLSKIDPKVRTFNFSQGIMKLTSYILKHPPNKKGKDVFLRYILKIKM